MSNVNRPIRINLKYAKCLSKNGSDDVLDALCILKLGEEENKSKVIYGSSNPEWNETFYFSWDRSSILVLSVLDISDGSKCCLSCRICMNKNTDCGLSLIERSYW